VSTLSPILLVCFPLAAPFLGFSVATVVEVVAVAAEVVTVVAAVVAEEAVEVVAEAAAVLVVSVDVVVLLTTVSLALLTRIKVTKDTKNRAIDTRLIFIFILKCC
jgi:uncharacterized BrkB/YihY/UPF0761 family membrane protein